MIRSLGAYQTSLKDITKTLGVHGKVHEVQVVGE